LKLLEVVLMFLSVLTATGCLVALILGRLGVFEGLVLIITWVMAMLFLVALLLIAIGGREGAKRKAREKLKEILSES